MSPSRLNCRKETPSLPNVVGRVFIFVVYSLCGVWVSAASFSTRLDRPSEGKSVQQIQAEVEAACKAIQQASAKKRKRRRSNRTSRIGSWLLFGKFTASNSDRSPRRLSLLGWAGNPLSTTTFPLVPFPFRSCQIADFEEQAPLRRQKESPLKGGLPGFVFLFRYGTAQSARFIP